MVLQLKNPDFTTAQRVADTINTLYFNSANPLDAGRVEVRLPQGMGGNPSRFIAELENLEIRPDAVARVVVNERTGTVVMGADVRVSTVAVAHGNLTVRIEERPEASQPDPFSMGETAILPRTDVEVTEDLGQLLEISTNTNVQELVEALNGVGASPRDVISILQAIDRAGALYGELVIQ
jgi:flagellar P-ring protein precursor FlgI